MAKFRKIVLKSILLIGIFVFLFFIFVGIGLLNHKNFQKHAKLEAEVLLKEYFSNRNENLVRIDSPDYTIDQIELGAVTDKNSYYVILFVTNSFWVTGTALNLIIEPNLIIHHIELKQI